MEVEMKAKISMQQVLDLVDGKFEKFRITRGGGWHAIHKVDAYYSFGGIAPKKPKDIIRIRSEALVDPAYPIEDIVRQHYNFKIDENFKSFLTVKAKNTEADGTEVNEEYEGELNIDATNAFLRAMEVTNFKQWFRKVKTSISFYVEEISTMREIHCEIVTVNEIGPFLEVECVIDDPAAAKAASSTIKKFFKTALGITEFEKRDWPTIIEQGL